MNPMTIINLMIFLYLTSDVFRNVTLSCPSCRKQINKDKVRVNFYLES